MTTPLNNGLAELLVVVGMDRYTGLVASKQQPCSSEGSEELTSIAFKPQILAAISSQVALFPQMTPWKDDHYPPFGKAKLSHKSMLRSTKPTVRRRSSQLSHKEKPSELHNDTKDIGRSSSYHPLDPRRLRQTMLSRKWTFTSADLAPMEPERSPVSFLELPVGRDMLHSLTSLCFPDGTCVYSHQPEEHVHFLVLTDVMGDWTYATCLTAYSPHLIQLVEPGCWKCGPCPVTSDTGQERDVYYLPTCYVVISKYPYFTVLKDCLSRLVGQLHRENSEQTQRLLELFALQLTMMPAPPPGKLSIEFSLFDVTFCLHPSDAPGRPVIDLSLNLILQCFSIESLSFLVACVLSQQKIVILARTWALLTVISQTLLYMVAPARWNNIYVPVLPDVILELLEAPGIYIIGCHSRHKEHVLKLDGVVVADCDSGEICVCETLQVHPLPERHATGFRDSCKTLQHHFELDALQRVTAFTYEETRLTERKRRDAFNHGLLLASLELMVNLFRGVLPHLKPARRFFNRDQFLEDLPDVDRPFYEQVLATDLFSNFLKERLAGKQDCWTLLEERWRPHSLYLSTKDLTFDSSKGQGMMRRNVSILSIPMLSKEPSQEVTVQLPKFVFGLGHHFFEHCIDEFTHRIKMCESSRTHASLLYLRGMALSATGNTMKAIEDFHNLGACDKRLFPNQHVIHLVSKMTTHEKDVMRSSEFYRRSEAWLDTFEAQSHDQPVVLQLDKLQHENIDLANFTDMLQFLEIVSDVDVIQRLFQVLTRGTGQALYPGTFDDFLRSWKSVELATQDAVSDTGLSLEGDETVLKLSQPVKCDLGFGFIGLTQKRLIFLSKKSGKFHEIIELQDIAHLEKIQQKQFLFRTEALRIWQKDKRLKPFVAGFKESRDTMYLLITEMWSGVILADILCEPIICYQVALNVLLIDAVLRCWQGDFIFHDCPDEGALSPLCQFTQRKKEGNYLLPPLTKEFLLHRLDPNYGLPQKVAVETLLYIPAKCSSEVEEEWGAMLWCGLGDGHVRVFSLDTLGVDDVYVRAKDRVVCFLLVGETQVWAGSFDTCIYVIDIDTRTCNQALVQHTDMVSDLTQSDDLRVFSSSVNGQIIEWNTQTLQCKQQLALPGVDSLKYIKIWRDQLWCGTRHELVVMTMAGVLVRRLDNLIQSPGSFDIINDKLWLSSANEGEIIIFNICTMTVMETLKLTCRGVSKVISLHDKVWVGSKDGVLYLYDAESHGLQRKLKTHSDSLRSLCTVDNRCVVTGAGSLDGKIALWRA